MQTCVWPHDSAPHEARSGVDVCVHHTLPDRGVNICWALERIPSMPKRNIQLIHHAGRLIKRTITHAGGAVCLVCYH
jgi:hypothetical protein